MSKILLFIGIFFFIPSLHAQTFNGTGGVIPDAGAQTCFNIPVTGVGTINGTYGLASVCLNIAHDWDADLEIYLRSPDGTLVPLSLQNGVAGVNYTNTCFTSTAATQIINGTPPYTGNFRPEGNLGAVNNGQNANGAWSLCIQDLAATDQGNLLNWSILFNNTPAAPPVVPANDNPCSAIPLTVNSSCNYTVYTNENATNTTGVPAPGCASYAGGDVWFSVTVPAGGALIFDTQTGVVLDGGMAIYSGTCAGLTLITCNDDGSNNGAMPMINATGLVPGSTVWIRFWEYGNNNNGTFGICVTTPPPPPTNDEPCTAFNLPVNNSCNFSYYTNVGATASAVPNPGCGNYQGADVWFRVTVPPGGSIIFDSNTGTMTDGDMAVYSGTCTGLTLLACDDLSSVNGVMASITLSGLTPGATLWVRFWGYGAGNTGTFQLCASIPPPPTVQDCPAALAICQNIYHEGVSYSGTGSIPNEINSATSCLSGGERADVWYTFTVTTSGNLNFTITPDVATDDYDWAVYNLTNANCAAIYNNPALNVSCNFSLTPGNTGPTGASAQTNQAAGGTPFNAQIPVVAGQTYVINVSNYTLSANGYTINFGASTASIFDNVAPQLQSVNASTLCGGAQVSVNFSENILCNTIQSADFAITGPGGPYTVTGWSSLSCSSGATYANNVILTVSPALSTNGSYQVCLTNASGSVTDLCGNVAPPGCFSFNVVTTVPTFNPVASICSGSTAPVLPLTSLNGITGTWSPATVNNTATTTYTFTPNTGQCATTATLTVTITTGIASPTVTSPINYCQGSASVPLTATGANLLWYTNASGGTGSSTAPTPSTATLGTVTYYVSQTIGGCESPRVPIVVTVSSVPVIYVHGTNPTCAGICDGTATVDITGGTGPFIFTWSNAGNTQTITGLCAGTYSVIVTDQNGCISSVSPVVAPGCFQIQSVLVDACSATEYDQEMVFFQVGQNPLNTAPLTVTWPTAADSWNGLCTNPAFIATVNATITGGGSLLPLPASGILPANANVVLITSTTATSASSFANLAGPLYALFQCNGNTQGHFANNSGAAGPRTLVMNFGAGCTDTTIYNTNQLINVSGTTGGNATQNNGAYVNYSFDGTPVYLNYGCTIPTTIQSAQVTLTATPLVIPTFNAIAPVCQNAAAPVLPISSTNTVPITGTWSPAVSTASGGTTVYTFTPAAGQCAATATLSITVNPNVTSTTNTTICTNQLPYTWNGQTYATGGPHIVTLINAAGCDSVATLNLTVNPNVTSTTNTTICVNQLPYNWNGQTYATGGPHMVTLMSAAGCDSVATLNLTVNPNVTSTTNTTICTNQLPYTWNGQTYATGGPHTVTLVSAAGCDSVATLNLTVNPNVSSTTNTTICINQLPYTWNGQIYATGGPHMVTLMSAAGCDSVATLNLTVNPNVTSTTNTTICTNQLPYTWNGQTYATGGPHTVTLVSAAGCDSVATLNLTVNPNVSSTTNTTICINQLPYTWNGQIYATGGPHMVTLMSAAGCDSVATLNLTVNPNVTSTTNTTICVNQLPYTWNGQTYATGGPHTVTLVSAAGCDSIATLNLTVNPNVTSTTNTTICTNQLPYTWNGQTYATGGPHTVTLISAAGCDSVATLNLTVNPNVTSTTNTTICVNQLPYTWNGQTYATGGPHTVTLVSTAGCDSVATLNLTVNPNVTSTTNTTICVNQLPYTWNGQIYATGGPHTVTLISAAGCDSLATLNLTVNTINSSTTNLGVCPSQLPYSWNGQVYNIAGTYLVTLTGSTGCDSLATLNLTVSAVSTSTTNQSICSSQLPYSWNGQSYNLAGTYSVNLIGTTGCDSIATLNLVVNPNVTSTSNATICSNQLPYTWNGQTYASGGPHTVTLVSAAGCDSVATLNLNVNPNVTSTTNTTICTNQLPYTWNGQTYASGGPHTVTLVSAAGCDSVATLNLTVNPNVSSTTNTTICTNQLPYTWNGQTYATGGPHIVTLVSTAGCDSVATLNLTVNPNVTSTTNTTICVNQLPYTWNGQTYATAGPHTVTLVSAAGCDSVATLNLTVNTINSSTTNLGVCPSQLPYSWNGQVYNIGGTYVVTLTGSTGCDSLATLNLTVSAVSTSTTNQSICSSQLPYSWNGQSYNLAGTYSVNLIGTTGCDSIATLNLIVNPNVTSTTNTIICTNQLPYTWNGQTYTTGGLHTVTLVSAAGCDSVATLNLTVNPNVTSTTNTSICTNQLPYTWNGQTYVAGGPHIVTLVSASGCDSVATLNLIVNPNVTSTTNTTICTNQLPYTWNGQTYASGGPHTVTLVSTAGCDSVATLNLTVNPNVSSTTNTTICVNQLPYTWNGQIYATGGPHTVTLISAAGCDSVATLNLTVNPNVTSTTNTTICTNQLPYTWNGQTYATGGPHTVTLVSAAGCDSVATLNLTVNTINSSTTNLGVCPSQLPYSWNGQVYNIAGTYLVTLTGSAGCDSLATLNLIVSAVSTSTTNQSICSSQLPYSWNGQSYNLAGTYSANLIGTTGCDSIATLNLVVNPNVTSTTNTSICTNQLPYTWNGQTYSAGGPHTVTLVSAAGCDSVATLNLTVNPNVTSTTNTTICVNQLPYTWNGQTYPTGGPHIVTLVSAGGCDSVATLNLTVNTINSSTTNLGVCPSQLPYSWNGQVYNIAGTYVVTLAGSTGCDSLATLNLTVSAVSTSTTNQSICSSQLPYSWNGQSYNLAGTYSVNLIGTTGCDSIATLNLVVNPNVTSTSNATICSNQLPYSWNGQTYPIAGTYSVTLTSSADCDSVATLNLSVNNILTSTTNTTICSNQLPYSWNGQTYPIAGTYAVTLTSSAGCDSVATLNLTVNNTLTSTTNTTICSNQLPYSWNGQTYPIAGTYSITLTSTAGCDSVATLNLSVNNILTSTTNTTICSNQLPYTWNGQTYPLAGTYAVTLTSTAGCDSVATLNLSVNNILTSTTNTTICSNQLPYSWNGQTYPIAGTYAVTLTSSAGCDSVATLNLSINNILTSTTNTTICSNQLPYSWNGQTYPLAGTYSVTLTNSAGCDSVATLNLSVNNTLTSTTNTTICSNQLPYSWNGQTYSIAGTYAVTLTSTAGCDSVATLNLSVNNILTSTTNTTICSNQLPYSWNGQTYPLGGTYSVTLTSSAGCDSVVTLNLSVNNILTSTTNTTICSNQLPYTWNGQTYPLAGTYAVTLTSTAGCDSVATLNLSVNNILTSTTNTTICSNQLPYSWNGQTYPIAGNYSVTLTSSAGCDSVATLNLSVNNILTSTTNTTICSNQLPYSWNGQTYPLGGTYSVTLTSSAGCDSVATLNLSVNNTLTNTTNTTICSNQLPYSWNGQTYPLAGTYSITLTSSAGCDSVATLNLSVNNTLTSTTNTTICSNQLPYSWNGQIYPIAGTYAVTLISSAGCDSVATLNLSVNNILTSTTNTTICSNQLSYTWNGQTYALAGTYAVTLISSAGCDSVATLNLSVNNTLTSTTSTTICSNQLPYSWNGQTYQIAGTYAVTLISSVGCDSTATLNLVVNPILTSITNVSICVNQLPYTWNAQTYATGGPHTVTLMSAAGCDSIATLNLTVNPNVMSTTNATICVNQLPYTWNGQTYATGGPHTVTLVSAAGCDSVATLNLTVNQNVTSTTNVTVCSNQLPYSWNGQSYLIAGNYAVSLTSAAGCDSTATLHLNINNITTGMTNTSICSNQLPYSWNGQSYSIAGNYVVILTGSNGCDSAATLNLTVRQVTTSTTNTSICSNQFPYSWNGQSYSSAGLYSVTLSGSNGCDSIAALNLTVKAVTTSTTNVNSCSNQVPYNWNGQPYSITGSYIVTLTGSNGCDSLATLNLIVNPVVTSTTNASVCNNHLPYNWNGQVYNTSGNYPVTLTSAAGCDSIATLHLTVNPVVNSITNITICSSELPYSWNGQMYNTAGTHAVTLTSYLGCDSVAKLNLTINQTPVKPAVTSPVTYCQHEPSIPLTAVATGNLIWYTNATGGTGSAIAPVPATTIPGTYQYWVSQSVLGCESGRALIVVTVNATPKLGADKSLRICFGGSANFSNLYNTAGLQVNWTFSQLVVDRPDSITVAGLYQLIATSSAGCSDTAMVDLGIQPQVIANAGNDGNAEYNAPYQLNGTGGVAYEWSPAGPLNNSHIAAPVAILTADTRFILEVKDDIGCADYDTVNIRVFKGPTFYVPTAFTPNGDGLNDIFRPTAVGIASLEYFRVFNRYGQLVYETSDISKGWDGIFKGKKQPIDNYVWTIKGIDRKGELKMMRGNVVLIR